VLSTHILPEVAQTCQKVVIINKGKIVATDTPDALTERLRGAVTMFVQAQGPPTTCSARCSRFPASCGSTSRDAGRRQQL
jgi:ABC-2 type transport system ATP-binding protein